MIYLLISAVCLSLYILINWWDKEDLTLGMFGMLLMVAAIPIVNLFVLALLVVATFQDNRPGTVITILKGRK
jgi:hypothetical protein